MIIDDTNRDLVANNIYLSQRVGSLTARIKRLEEALKPFARVDDFDVIEGVWSHRGDGSVQIVTREDFRRARVALEDK